MMPHGFLRAAATRNATVEAKTVGGKKYNVVTFVGDNKAKVNGYINEQNHGRARRDLDRQPVPRRHARSRRSTATTRTSAARSSRCTSSRSRAAHPIFDLNVDRREGQRGGEHPGAAGTRRRAGGSRGRRRPPRTQSEKLGDGVYLITGGYAVIAVDFKDYIALIESGQNEARALAVIAEAKRLIPNKPIKYVINTHSHIDHSSGLRGVRRRRLDDPHAPGEQGVSREGPEPAAHAQSGQGADRPGRSRWSRRSARRRC